MIDTQKDNYLAMDIPDEEDGTSEGQGSFNIVGMQIGNMVFPNEDTKVKPSEKYWCCWT